MGKLPVLSGEEVCNILRKRGFQNIRQRGSHIVLKKVDGNIGTVVPNHRELKIGTLKGILKLAKVNEETFAEYL